jgi:hypothetical protein
MLHYFPQKYFQMPIRKSEKEIMTVKYFISRNVSSVVSYFRYFNVNLKYIIVLKLIQKDADHT